MIKHNLKGYKIYFNNEFWEITSDNVVIKGNRLDSMTFEISNNNKIDYIGIYTGLSSWLTGKGNYTVPVFIIGEDTDKSILEIFFMNFSAIRTLGASFIHCNDQYLKETGKYLYNISWRK